VRTLKRYLRPYLPQFVFGPMAKLIEAVIELYLPMLMAYMIDFGVSRNNVAVVREGSVKMGILIVVGLLFSLICQYLASIASQGVGTHVRDGLYDKIMSMPTSDLENFGTGSLTNRLTVDVTQLQVGVAMSIRLLTRAPFLCIGGFIMAATIHLRLSLIILIAIPLSIVLLYFVMRATVRLFKIAQIKLDKLAELAQDNLTGARVIRAFHRQEREREFFGKKNHEWETVLIKAGNIAALVNPFTVLIFNIAIVGVLYAGGLQIQAAGLTQGELIALVNYLTQIVAAMIVAANLVITLTKAIASGERIAEVFTSSEKVERAEDMALLDSDRQDTKSTPALLVCERLTFTYPNSGEPALSDIGFSLGRGETLGVIGGTGSGKSTLAYLLSGIHTPSGGEIQLNGIPLEKLERNLLQSRIHLVFQKPTLFSGTVESNLRLGAPEATEAELWEALRIAQAEDFVRDKQNGLNHEVERDGTNFSGGQKQRLAIARGLVSRPDLLILDDSSSALDYLTDAAFSSELSKWKGRDTSLIVISQRIYQVARMDRILVLDNGKPCGLGTHDELLLTSRLYREIYESQQDEDEGRAK
jgi:ATP-binding cassette subfamily B multidrug efflux pump